MNSSLKLYFELVAQRPELFLNPLGASHEILLDESSIDMAQRASPKIGVVVVDRDIMFVRDVVRRLDGSLGIHPRIVDLHPEVPGVVVFTMCRDEILLVNHFRHSTRHWHLEAPRGYGLTGDALENAKRELSEEINAVPMCLSFLGSSYPDSGSGDVKINMVFARVKSYSVGDDVNEGIKEIVPVSIENFEQMIRDGRMKCGLTMTCFAAARSCKLL